MLTAKVVGTPEPSVQWNKGKWMKMNSYGRFKISHDRETHIHTLEISTLDMPDTGCYR